MVLKLRLMPALPRNAPGDFYVENDCCLLCGVPWHYAGCIKYRGSDFQIIEVVRKSGTWRGE